MRMVESPVYRDNLIWHKIGIKTALYKIHIKEYKPQKCSEKPVKVVRLR